MSLIKDTPNQLERLLGVDFISYCTATTKEDVLARLRAEKPLPPGAESALARLADLCNEAVQHSATRQIPTDLLWDFFAGFDADENLSLANAIRRQAGGQILEPQHPDALIQALQRIAVNVYPLLLIPPSGVMPWPHVPFPMSLGSYPMAQVAVDAILRDADLSRLHPQFKPQDEGQDEDDPARAMSGWAVHRTIESVIIFVFNKAKLQLLAMPSAEHLCQGIPESVATAKKLIQGKSVSLPIAIGLSNIKLPPGVTIESKLGRLSEYTYLFDSWVPVALRGNRLNQTSDQGQYEFLRGSGDIILQMEQKSRLRFSPPEAESYYWQLSAVDASAANRQSIICLAITLGVSYETPLAVIPTWAIGFSPIVTPMTNSGGFSPQAGSQRTMAPLRVLAEEECDAWNKWISKVNSIGFKGIEVAARRIQIAIAERYNPVDRFVDSIIAWENLFGGGSEMTFRISCSIALLLGTDSNHRRQLQKEATELYRLRGAVVHGATQVSDGKASESASAGLEIAIKALRKIYTEKPEMIKADSPERSLMLILRHDPPTPEEVAPPSSNAVV